MESPVARGESRTIKVSAAQTTFATITGNVTDPTRAVVPGVVKSNYKYTTRSDEAGSYTLPQLREGQYTLRAACLGSASSECRTSSWRRAKSAA